MTSLGMGPDPTFFNNGVMNAALNCVGNTPAESDLLNSSVTNGASTSAQSLRRRVGIGSAAHCLSGSLWMAAMTGVIFISSIRRKQVKIV